MSESQPSATSYEQICVIAFALDVVGARWTPLILRDLLRTPLRFTDLLAINPTMSPSLLTARLKHLEAHGIIERDSGRGTSRSKNYALSASARPLVEQLLQSLASLGAHVIEQNPPDGDLNDGVAHQMELNGHFVMARASELTGYFVLDLSGTTTHIVIDTEFSATTQAPADRTPDASAMFFPPTTLMRIMARVQTLEEAEAIGLAEVSGDRPKLIELLDLLSFEPDSD